MSGAVATMEISGRVARLVLDCPQGNEMGRDLFDGLGRFVREVLPALDVDGMIVMGRGRHFSSGADVAELRSRVSGSGDAGARRMLLDNVGTFSAIEACRYPVVAAISGCCLGSGLELALACHYRLAARGALLALPEVEHGLMPGCGGTVRLAALVGRARAMEMILTGRALTAEEALAEGLVDHVTGRHDLLATAERIVQGLRSPGEGPVSP